MTQVQSPIQRSSLLALSLSALGVVFGDIGTSPLYAFRECFTGHNPLLVTDENVLGVLSLIFWSLIIVVTCKYLLFVMRADNKGEGGVLALMALINPRTPVTPRQFKWWIMLLGLFGAALLYGDGIITPAISVLSAVEGLEVATPLFKPYVLPLTVAVLVAVFMVQKRGTARIGTFFGPVILLWFLAIAILGIRGILENPGVLAGLNPYWGYRFFAENQGIGFKTLGAVVLVVTGGEALYADMGHFGRKPIKLGWFFVVFPALILNYLGQGAAILDDHRAAANPFFHLAPSWALYPMVILATSAAVIAAQALISGSFSITKQAIQLGYLPRISIQHTSKEEIGQIYIPFVNWFMLFGTIFLVLEFRNSSSLAAAYGIAVTGTMVTTTVLIFFVARDRWQWPFPRLFAVTAGILAVDLAFFGANLFKFLDGGWVPVVLACVILFCMMTWRRGRSILARRLVERAAPMQQYIEELRRHQPPRVPGTAIVLASSLEGAPPSFVHNVKHNKIMHENVVFTKLVTEDVPYVPLAERFVLEEIGNGLYRMVVRYGFMDTPNVPAVMSRALTKVPGFRLLEATYFLGRETLIPSSRPGMMIWRERLFVFMAVNAQRATYFFRIPPNQVIEIGLQIEL